MKKNRDSNFELLRLLAMYMIVLIHANIYVGNIISLRAATVYNALINGICNIGVSLFILISGYYGVSFNVKKISKLELKMITYSLLVFGLSLVVYAQSLSGGDKLELLVKSLLPFTSRNHWFYSCYVLIVLFSGFIDKFVGTMDKKSFRIFLGVMLFCFSVLPTFLYFEIVPDNGKGIVQMFMVYMIGRYIRIYGKQGSTDGGSIGDSEHRDSLWDSTVGKAFRSRKMLLIMAAIMWVLNAISFDQPINFGGIYHTLCKDNSITNMIFAVSVFLLFKDLKLKSGIINTLARYIFAVFAMNYILVDMLFGYLEETYAKTHEPSPFGLLIMLGASLLVLLGCILVGVIRDFLLGWLDERVAKGVERIFNSLRTKFI